MKVYDDEDLQVNIFLETRIKSVLELAPAVSNKKIFFLAGRGLEKFCARKNFCGSSGRSAKPILVADSITSLIYF